MRDCRTSDERLFAFVDGVETDLDEHVAACQYCQEFLAELWEGELQTDLSESVLRRIRFDEFLRELGRLTTDVAAAMARALIEYGPGGEETRFGDVDSIAQPEAESPGAADDEE
jgi:hypothetical protein